jgi:hypothetical protein
MNKLLKTAAFVAVSAALGYILAAMTAEPQMFGYYAPVINLVLVAIKQYVDSRKAA